MISPIARATSNQVHDLSPRDWRAAQAARDRHQRRREQSEFDYLAKIIRPKARRRANEPHPAYPGMTKGEVLRRQPMT